MFVARRYARVLEMVGARQPNYQLPTRRKSNRLVGRPIIVNSAEIVGLYIILSG